MALDLVGGSLFKLLYDGVKQAMVKNSQFKSLLADLKSTLDSLEPRLIEQIGEHNTELGLPNEEIQDLQRQMEEGVKLVKSSPNFQQQKAGDVTEALDSGNNIETVPETIQGNGIQVATLDGGDALEAVFGMLFYAVLEVEDKAVMFKAPLGDLKSTLNSLKPLIEEIAQRHKALVRPKEELEKITKQMEKGVELIPKCSKVARDVKSTIVLIRNVEMAIKQIEESGVLLENQTKGCSAVAEPSPSTLGLDVVLNVEGTRDVEETMISIRNTEASMNVEGTRDVEERMFSIRNAEAGVKPIDENGVVQNQLETKGTKNASEDYTLVSGISRIFSKKIVSDTSSSAATSLFSEATTSTSRSKDDQSIDGHISLTSNLRVFSYEELNNATRNFRSDSMIGEGRFGRVFKGWLDEKTLAPSKPGTGMFVAIKKLNHLLSLALSEVNFLRRHSHPNLVKLLGYCREENEKLLVFEYMQKGSLENHLFRINPNIEPLSWDSRIKIAIGAARGLAFLHSLDNQVIYRDFKASNILIDLSYNAKISDFGLAKLGSTGGDSLVSTRVMETYRYVVPEYAATGHLYVESDVYGFGVVLLEMLTGLRFWIQIVPRDNII
ncbi:hypothetical protein M0R45_031247 [Rubus argutus]|uniref:Protein kinase domain-containing protein n=1 Tax=Rubus argutus TaxID=59490 RepID=A0AAW1WDP6_RUBAR